MNYYYFVTKDMSPAHIAQAAAMCFGLLVVLGVIISDFLQLMKEGGK